MGYAGLCRPSDYSHPEIPKCEGVRIENWKYIRYFKQQPVYEELYDLKNDKLETQNLISDLRYAKVLGKLRRKCDELRELYGGVYKFPKRADK